MRESAYVYAHHASKASGTNALSIVGPHKGSKLFYTQHSTDNNNEEKH